MGWGSGTNLAGREVGYLVDAVCDLPECDTKIDRGLAYCCGGMHDGMEHGGAQYACGGYFCSEHLYLPPNPFHGFVCGACLEAIEAFGDEDWDVYRLAGASPAQINLHAAACHPQRGTGHEHVDGCPIGGLYRDLIDTLEELAA